jgi:hypothetical protein
MWTLQSTFKREGQNTCGLHDASSFELKFTFIRILSNEHVVAQAPTDIRMPTCDYRNVSEAASGITVETLAEATLRLNAARFTLHRNLPGNPWPLTL